MATKQKFVPTFPEGARVRYTSRVNTGVGNVIESYLRATGEWVIVHDRKRNASVTVRPSQVKAVKARTRS